MRGSVHAALHAYYVLLVLALLYGDSLASSGSWEELASRLWSLARAELVVAVAVFMDVSRAPDCDISCRGSVLGLAAYAPASPLVKSHRGWYHSVWAALYVACFCAALTALLAHALLLVADSLGVELRLSVGPATLAVFASSLLSYCLHLAEDSLTRSGVRWLGRLGPRVRGPVSTGRSDAYAAALLVGTSAVAAAISYPLTRSFAASALVGILALALDFALLTRAGRSSAPGR